MPETTVTPGDDNEQRPAMFSTAFHEIAFLSLIMGAIVMAQAQLGNVIIPLGIIGADLKVTDASQLTWFVSAFSLSTGALLLVTGRCGDVFGQYKMLIFGYTSLGLFHIIGGCASWVDGQIFYIIMRALQGIGIACMVPNAAALLARAYPPSNRKSFVFALFGASAPVGFTLSAILGAVFAQYLWWPWIEWSMAIVAIILAVSSFFFIPPEIREPVQKGGKIDYIGSIVGAAGLVAVVYATNEGPITGWGKPQVFVVLIIGIFLLAGFLYIESKVKQPVLPSFLWFAPTFPGAIACIALGWASFGIWSFYIVRFFQDIRGASPLDTGCMFIPFAITGLCAATFVWKMYSKLSGKILMIIAMSAFCLGLIMLAFAPEKQTYWGMTFISLLIIPFGMVISFPAASLIFSNALSEELQGVAASMINTVLNLTIALGLGLAATIQGSFDEEGTNILKGYRSACYFAIGLSAVGIVVASLFCKTSQKKPEIEMQV